MSVTVDTLKVVLGMEGAELQKGFRSAAHTASDFKEHVEHAGKAAREVGEHANHAGGFLHGFGHVFRELTGPMAGFITGIASIEGLFELLHTGVEIGGKIDRATVAMEGFYESTEKAKEAAIEVAHWAASTTLDIPTAESAATRLVQMGVDGEQLIPTLKTLADLAQGNAEKFDLLASVYGKMKSIGSGEWKDIRKLAAAGIPIFDQLAKNMGVTKDKLKGLSKEGSIGLREIQQAMKDLTDQGGAFANASTKQASTMDGAWIKLKSNVGLLGFSIIEAFDEAFNVKGAVSSLADLVQTITGYVGPAARHAFEFIAESGTHLAETLGPAFEGTGQFLASSFQSIMHSVGDAISWIGAHFDSLKLIGVAAWDELVAGARLMGDVVGSVFSLVGQLVVGQTSNFEEFATKLAEVFKVVEFNVTNWREIWAISVNEVILLAATFAADIENLFGSTIPKVLNWLVDNWHNLFVDLFEFLKTVFLNLGENVVNVFKNLPGLIAGTTDFSSVWGPLLDGFKSTMGEFPDIAKRAMTDTEKNLSETLANQTKELADARAKFAGGGDYGASGDFGGGISDKEIESIMDDYLTSQGFDLNSNGFEPDAQLSAKKDKKGKKDKTELKALEQGSADAFSAERRAGSDPSEKTAQNTKELVALGKKQFKLTRDQSTIGKATIGV